MVKTIKQLCRQQRLVVIKPCFARVTAFMSLCRAARRTFLGKSQSAEAAQFMVNMEREILQLETELLKRTYCPRPYRRFSIADPKPRMICAAAFRDRVIQHALCAELQSILEFDAVAESYACRQGKGAQAAVHWVQHLTRRFNYALKLDVRRFFATVDHAILRQRLFCRITEKALQWLICLFLKTGVTGVGTSDDRGLPIGNLTSQYFANFYLGSLDHFVKRHLRSPGYCRYMDDLLLFGNVKAELWRHAAAIEAFSKVRLKLALRSEVTQVAPVSQGVVFLGYRIWPQHKRLDAARLRRFRRQQAMLQNQLDSQSIDEQDAANSATSRLAWAAQANTLQMRRTMFAGIMPALRYAP